MWTLFRGTSLLLLLTTTVSANIGLVTAFTGSAAIERDEGFEVYEVEKDLGVEMLDVVSTAKGKVQIDFIDETRVDVTEHSRLLIDDFVYDPKSNSGKLNLKAAAGTVRYVSGNIAHNNPNAVNIKTPTAAIAVRGTDFSMTVDETGQSLVVLLPSCKEESEQKKYELEENRCKVGKIIVSNDAGTVVLDKAFEATYVMSATVNPTQPVIVNTIEGKIGNNLIIDFAILSNAQSFTSGNNRIFNFLRISKFERFHFTKFEYVIISFESRISDSSTFDITIFG